MSLSKESKETLIRDIKALSIDVKELHGEMLKHAAKSKQIQCKLAIIGVELKKILEDE